MTVKWNDNERSSGFFPATPGLEIKDQIFDLGPTPEGSPCISGQPVNANYHPVTVIGLDMHPSQRKIAIGCDKCIATFGGGYKWNEGQQLRDDARAAGWTLGASDLCPACAKLAENHPRQETSV